MIKYISDLHIGHANAIKFDGRPFRDIEEMERVIIRQWNETVSPSDDVYIVGDIFYKYKKPYQDFLNKLSGHLHLIVGNHDRAIFTNEVAMSRFETVDKMIEIVDEGKNIVLCHFPLAEWRGMQRGTWHIYGHIHAEKGASYEYMRQTGLALNCGCMINDYHPCTFDELWENNQIFWEV